MVVTTRRRRPPPGQRPAFKPHRHEAADGEPADHDGRRVCTACGKTGKPGDAQHPVDATPLGNLPPVPAEVLAWEAQRLGERG